MRTPSSPRQVLPRPMEADEVVNDSSGSGRAGSAGSRKYAGVTIDADANGSGQEKQSQQLQGLVDTVPQKGNQSPMRSRWTTKGDESWVHAQRKEVKPRLSFGGSSRTSSEDGSKDGSKTSSMDSGSGQTFLEQHPPLTLRQQALYVLSLIGLAALSVYALAPRLTFDCDEASCVTLDLLQIAASCAFAVLYGLGARRLAHTAWLREEYQRKTSEDYSAITESRLRRMWREPWRLEHLQHPINVLLQLVLAALVPSVCDLLAMAGPSLHPLRFVGLLRLLHLVPMRTAFQVLGRNFLVPYFGCFLLRSALTLTCTTHYVACLFWLLARLDDFSEDTWVGRMPWLSEASVAKQYLYSLYFATVTASTVGYGDLVPVAEAEVVLAILFIFVNIVISANIVGGISALAALADTKMATHRHRIATFERMLTQERISTEVADATRDYLRLQLNMHEADVDELPMSVRIRIREERWSDAIASLPLMRGVSRRFVSECGARVKPDAFVSGLVVCRAGDMSTRLCIVLEGHAALQLEQNLIETDESVCETGSKAGPGSSTTVAMLRPGSCFGAEGFVSLVAQPWDVKAVTMLRVVTLNVEDQRELQSAFPNEWALLRSNLTNSMRSIKEAADKMARSMKTVAHGWSPRRDTSWSRLESRSMLVSRVKLHDQRIWLPLAEATSALMQQNLAAAARRAEEESARAASRACQEVAGLLCDMAAKGDTVELERTLDMIPIASIPGDYDGREALHLAAAGGHDDAVELLVKHGANINVVDRFGRTPLTEAVLNGKDKIITFLRSRGARLEMKENDVAGTLCEAAHRGDTVLVRRYLSAGADPNSADYDRRTGLMLAAAEGQWRICEALLNARADPTFADRWGHKAMDEAVAHGHQGPIIELLTNAAKAWQEGKQVKAAAGTSGGPDGPSTTTDAAPDGRGDIPVDFSLT